MVQRKKLFFELAMELLLTALVVMLLVISYQPQRILVTTGDNMGPFVFPRIILFLFLTLLVCDELRIIRLIMHTSKATGEGSFNLLPKPVVLTLVAVVIYAILWNVIGFTLATILFLTVETKIVNSDVPVKKGLIVAVVGTIILLIIFVLLFKMEFPEPLLTLIRGY